MKKGVNKKAVSVRSDKSVGVARAKKMRSEWKPRIHACFNDETERGQLKCIIGNERGYKVETSTCTIKEEEENI